MGSKVDLLSAALEPPQFEPAPRAPRRAPPAPSLALSSRVDPALLEVPLPPPRALAPPPPGPAAGAAGAVSRAELAGRPRPSGGAAAASPRPRPAGPRAPRRAPPAPSLALSSRVDPALLEVPLPPPRALARRPPGPAAGAAGAVSRAELAGRPALLEVPLPPPRALAPSAPGPRGGRRRRVSRAELAGRPRLLEVPLPPPAPRPAGPRPRAGAAGAVSRAELAVDPALLEAPPAPSLAPSSRVDPALLEVPLPPPRALAPPAPGPRGGRRQRRFSRGARGQRVGPSGRRAAPPCRGRAPPPPPPFSIEVPDFDVDELLPGVPPASPHARAGRSHRRSLEGHPDPSLAARLAHGFAHGFPLQYRGPCFSAISRPEPSALEHIDVVRQDVEKEIAMGRVAGPFPSPPLAPFVASPVGAIPKKRSTKWRRIHNLSYPKHRGPSVNSGIDPDELQYQNTKVSMRRAIELLIQLGCGAEMAKADIESAFRLLAVRRKDWWLLGFALPSRSNPTILEFFIDLCLPFGARSSPRIFEDLGQALDFALRRRGCRMGRSPPGTPCAV
eukprot:tig00000658_g2908.t1